MSTLPLPSLYAPAAVEYMQFPMRRILFDLWAVTQVNPSSFSQDE